MIKPRRRTTISISQTRYLCPAGSTISASERRSSVINSMKNPITRTDNSPSFPFLSRFSSRFAGGARERGGQLHITVHCVRGDSERDGSRCRIALNGGAFFCARRPEKHPPAHPQFRGLALSALAAEPGSVADLHF